MELFLLVQVSPSCQLNLGPRHFGGSDLVWDGERGFRVALRDDPLSRAIRENMACELRREETVLLAGRVKSVNLKDQKNTVVVSE